MLTYLATLVVSKAALVRKSALAVVFVLQMVFAVLIVSVEPIVLLLERRVIG
jgi:hypothetical protein